jgi:5S rRNA maturation endonuclease (ribonuclease M5)
MESKTFILWDGDLKQTISVEATRSGKEWQGICPKHEDHKPSLAINEEKGVFYCHGCNWKGQLANEMAKRTKPKIKAIYDYQDEFGNLLFQVVRYEPKAFRARRRDEKGRWVYRLNEVDPVPYRLPELLKSKDTVFICEGEKDCDNLRSLGFTVTTAPFGAGKWRPEFNKFFLDREVIILPDNDLPGIEHAVTIAKSLDGKARSVRILDPKSLKLGEKGDISDWLTTKGGTREKLMEVLSDQRSFLNWEQGERELKDKKIQEILKKGDREFEREPLTAQNFQNGILSYGVVWDGVKFLVKSDKTLEEVGEAKFISSKLDSKTVRRFLEGEGVNGSDLVKRLGNLIRDHIFFKDQRVPILIAFWLLGTYFFEIFNFYGYLWVTSPTIRCAKSLLVDLLSQLAFNSTGRLVNPSVASLFRLVANDKATIIIDEAERLRNEDKEEFSALMSILNGGFQKHSIVTRIEKTKGGFTPISFPVYSPKILAGINRVSDTIEDRSFKIEMTRKTKTEKVQRLHLAKEGKEFQRLRSDMFLWALLYASEVAEVYEGLDEIKEISSLNDREKDTWEPLLSITLVVDEISKSNFFDILVSLALDMSKRNSEKNITEEAIPNFISLIDEMFPTDKKQYFISSNNLYQQIQNDENLSFITSKKSLANFIQKLGLFPSRMRIGSSVVRGYLFDRDWLEDLRERYV